MSGQVVPNQNGVGHRTVPAVAMIGENGETVGVKGSPVYSEPLGTPSVARQITVTTVSANVELTATVRRVSIHARGCDMRYAVGVGAQTANAATSHFVAQNERLDFAVPAGAHIAAIRETTAVVNGTLCVSELT